MRKSYQLLLVFFVTLASVVAISNSSALEFKSGSERVTCSCTFTGRKDYQLFNETNGILGRRVHRKWTCEYSCDSASHLEKSDKDKVIGSYEMTNRGEDNGLEGI